MGVSGLLLVIKFVILLICLTPRIEGQKRCDARLVLNITTPCTSCAASVKVLCPVGSKKITSGNGNSDCSYTVDLGGETLSIAGCSHTCQKTIVEKGCCEGFWGTECHDCPGGSSQPCSGHGRCLDGVTGNGTCLCNEKYGGFACQECADKNAFGPDCASMCDCTFGVCLSGISGNGSCICQSGYTGPKCDQESPSCKALNCGENSYCKEEGDRGPACECMPGYFRNGTTCSLQGPCRPSPCSPLASCNPVGLKEPVCTCKPGHQGDGKVCIPINPCVTQNGGCFDSTTRCLYKSPGKSSCACQPGMKSANVSSGCSSSSRCTPTACGKSARCESGPDQTFVCVCKQGEIGDSRNCYGDIMSQIQSLNTIGSQARKLTNALRMFEEGCALTLTKFGPFTVFVPLSKTTVDIDLAQYLCKLHIIPGFHLAADLAEIKTLWTLAGESLLFNEKVFKFASLPEEFYTIVQPNLPAANGVIHIISKARTAVSLPSDSYKQLRIGEILPKIVTSSRFQTMLENCGLPPILEGPGPFTVFVPSNDAVDTLRDGRLIYLFTQGKNKLQELVKNHIYSAAAVSVDKLITMQRINTMANQMVNINISRDGRILLGDSGVAIDQKRDIVASNGIIHALDGILIPSSIVPILPHQCSEIHYQLVTGSCSHCDSMDPCPSNSTDLGTVQLGCIMAVDYKTNQLGCARHCNKTVVEDGCCKGFFGPDCRPCPAGFTNPCYGRGLCSDGIRGNGSCLCFEAFRGLACHICSNPNKHGDRCEEDCRCVHGTCDNRPGSMGVCQPRSCKAGYTGELCDRRAEPCGPSGLSQFCHQHAICESSESSGNTTRCTCADGYEGDGFSCQPVDLCSKPQRGDCSENALCTSTGPGTATCRCNPGWTGDGKVCLAIDNCQLENRGGCHINADCSFVEPEQNTCTCKRGYAGDGFLCDPLDPCLENNGNCHAMAECKPLGAVERTCICPEHFAGDGMTCYGDVLLELESNPDFADFYQWIKKSLYRIPEGSNVTVLVPTAAAIKNLSSEVVDLWLKPYMLPFLVRAHFLRDAFTVDQLKKYDGQELSTLNPPTKWDITNINGTVMIQNASIVVADIPAVNGIIYVINKVLLPFVGDVPPPHPGLGKQLDLVPSFSRFKESLQQYELIEEIEASGNKYTIFVPRNDAVVEYCNASITEHVDNETMKYHIIMGEKLTQADLKNGMHKATMLGFSFWLMFYKRGNQTYINDVPLDGAVLETKNGMLMGVSRVLQIQRNHCDTNTTTIEKTKCNNCMKGIVCPAGTVLAESPSLTRKPDCTFKKRLIRTSRGCTFNCVRASIISGCCEGYFGHQCLMCPGKAGEWCSGNGICRDGIAGTGECICHEGFHGTACETCEPGRYGSDCKSQCMCVHGKCRDGLQGDGTCDCYKGWKGFTCSVDIDNDLCNGTCSHYANCVLGLDSMPTCACSAGYTGNGTHCSEFDACSPTNSGCSENANCTREAVGERTCTCREGYTGDGILCLEIDGCLENNGGCHTNAECTKTGPNLVACNCLPGYKGDGKLECEPINLCRESNAGCSRFGKCEPTGPGTRNCTCWNDYVGDGFTCVGKISMELNHNPAAGTFNTFLQDWKIKDLTGQGPYTVFIPHHDEVSNSTTFEEWTNKSLIRDLLLYHAVGCHQLLLSDLQAQTSITSLMGSKIRIYVKEDGGVYLNDEAKIIKSEIIAKNGVIHFIDKILQPYDLQKNNVTLQLSQQNITEATMAYGYTIFSKLLQDANLLSLVEDPVHRPFTMLWPTDAAFSALSEDRQRYLYHEDHRDKLAAYLKVHMIRDVKIVAANLPLVHVARTMYGSTISFKCSKGDIGELTVGEENAHITQRHMEFNGGIAHGIDQLLEPPNLGARCDKFLTVELASTPESCGSCSFVPACPAGSAARGKNNPCRYAFKNPFPRYFSSGMRSGYGFSYLNDYHDLFDSYYFTYRRPRIVMLHGCSKRCFSTNWYPECCKNHYGRDCQACPGGLENPCSNHGDCKYGIAESGECVCSNGFTGTACELCEPGRYGSGCLECNCTENGKCDEGISGDGSCFCSEGWSGLFCEIKQEVKPVCSPVCHVNATCRPDNICDCNPYFFGDGRTCTVVDRCSEENGGCSEHAVCTQLGVDVQCNCFLDYEGDGYVCRPIDRCVDGRNGGCSEHATCINIGPNNRRCECREGYVGNGIQCLQKAVPPVDRCLEMNGDCHPEAICADLHYQEKTAGVFHFQSPKGKYSFTYEEAQAGCAAEGASLATFQQLSAAQQLGLHICLVGWLDNGTAGYPTTYPNPSCGGNHVGIVDYGQRSNLTEKWDAFCFRVKDVQCICRDGYVGDGSFCNGNLLEVLATTPGFSIFHLMLLGYANATDKGLDFLDFLSNETSYKTLFVPLDSGFEDNMTLTWRDLEHHVSASGILLPSYNLTEGSLIPSRIGYNLSISNCAAVNCTRALDSKLVNNREIVNWDILAFNGIIHAIGGPLAAPLEPVVNPAKSQHHVIGGVIAAVIIGCLLIALAGGSCYYLKQRDRGIQFHYFKAEMEEGETDKRGDVNPPIVSIPNPVYGTNNSFFEPFGDSFEDDNCLDTHRILGDD